MLKRALACVVLLAAVCTARSAFAQNPVRYIYDDLGRLVGVIDQNGDAATYNYDAVGNLLSITRTSGSTVAIIEVSPGSGVVGATVTISGTGFSSTPSANTVTFNGTAATVSSATANQLVVAVPSGATTGTVAVTSPLGSATSATAFTVLTNLAPTIVSFSPAGGLAGTAVTVTGTNFDTVLANDRSQMNATYDLLLSGTSTSLSTTVPSNTLSGHISVATPYGTAVSADDFLIPPSPYGVSDVQVFGRIPFSSATTVTVSTLNKVGVMLFDSGPGHRISIKGTNGVSGHVFGCDISITLYKPNGTAMTLLPTCMEISGFQDVLAAPMTGTYTLLVDPADSVTGSVTLTVYDVPADFAATVTPSSTGGSVTVSTNTPGQNGALTFSGTAGHRVSVLGTNAMGGQVFGCDVNVSIVNPDKSVLAPATCMEFSGYIDAVTLPTTGTYTIFVDPADIATGNITLTAYDVSDVTGTITPTSTGSSVTVTTTTPGQNGTLTFSGTAGQAISLKGTNWPLGQVFGCDVNVSILNPDNSVLVPATCMETGGFIDTTTLPATGTYTIVVDPQSYATGSLTVTLYSVPSDVGGTITAGGSSVTVTTTTPGQNASLTFSGTSGERISLLGTNGMSGQVFGCDVNVTILKPNGTTLAGPTCMEVNGFIDAITLDTTGTYTVKIDPVDVAVGSLTLTLYNVTDVSATISEGGSPVTVTMTTPGQNALVTFSGTTGDRISLLGTNGMSGQTFFGCDVNVSILNPDGSALASPTCMEQSGFIDAVTLSQTGTYTIKVDPTDSDVGSLTLALYAVPADPTGTVTVGGSSLTLTTTTPGQNASATFSGTSSQQVTVHFTSNSMGSVTIKLLNPDGTQLTSTTSSASSFDLSTQTLPSTGTYTIVIDPAGANAGSISVNVTDP